MFAQNVAGFKKDLVFSRYETSTDDDNTLLFEVKVDATNLPLSLEFEALLNSHETSDIFKKIGNHELKGSYNMSPSEGTFEIAVSYNDKEAKLSFVKSGSDASVELSTSVPGFRSIKGKVKWMSKGLRTKYDFSLEMNGQRLLQGSLGHDQSPFTRYIFSLLSFSMFWVENLKSAQNFEFLL